MIPVPSGVRLWLATGITDVCKGFPGLWLRVQKVLKRDPLSGHLFVFRGRRSNRQTFCAPSSDPGRRSRFSRRFSMANVG
jgi:transposase